MLIYTLLCYNNIYTYEYKDNKPFVIKATVFFAHNSTEVIFVGSNPYVATATVLLGTHFLGNTARIHGIHTIHHISTKIDMHSVVRTTVLLQTPSI